MIDEVNPLRGVFSAAFTAIGPDGSVDEGRMAAHCRHLLDQGCAGVALLGTTGEANSLAGRERMALLEALVAAGVPAERLAPGTGVCSITETIDLTRHALSLGVRTVLLLPPFYYKDPDEAGLLDHFSRVIEATAAPDVRIVLYHIPQMTGVPIGFELIARLRARFGAVIAGVKDSSGDLAHMEALLARFPDLSVMAGADHLLGPLLRAGGAGCITATSNLIASRLADLFVRIDAGATAAETAALERDIAQIRTLFQRWPQIPALKAAMAERTGDPDWGCVRPPLRPLDAVQTTQMRQAMAEIGLA